MKKLGISILALLLLAGCSSEPTKSAPEEKPQPKAPELVTGRTAFQKMFATARLWARDAQPYRLQSQPIKDSNGHDGKSALWRAGFASPSRGASKPFTWSGIDSPDAPSRGVSPGNEDTYSASNASTHVFDIAFLKTDSDKAFEVAQKHGGEKLLAKDPGLNVTYFVDWNRADNELTWHIIYGDDRDNPKLKIAVNASTGEFDKVEK